MLCREQVFSNKGIHIFSSSNFLVKYLKLQYMYDTLNHSKQIFVRRCLGTDQSIFTKLLLH